MRIKKFHEFSNTAFEKKDEDFGILRDLENIGMQEKTYPRSLIKDALDEISFNDYVECSTSGDDFEFKGGEYPGGYEITADYVGSIAGEWDLPGLWSEIRQRIEKLDPQDYDPDYEEDRYTIDDIESAFDRTDFDRAFENALDGNWPETDIKMNPSEPRNGEVNIDPEAEVDTDAVEVSDGDLVDEILDNL